MLSLTPLNDAFTKHLREVLTDLILLEDLDELFQRKIVVFKRSRRILGFLAELVRADRSQDFLNERAVT